MKNAILKYGSQIILALLINYLYFKLYSMINEADLAITIMYGCAVIMNYTLIYALIVKIREKQ